MKPDRRGWGRLLLRATPLSARDAVAGGGWLVIAPHPDDETLGAGGLIAELAAAGGHVEVVFLTDGAGSHVGARGWPAGRVAALRTREAGAALRTLGSRRLPVALGWPDAAPHPPGSREHERSVRRLVALCRRHRIRNVVTSWEGDPHCDHAAAATLAREVARRLRVRARFYGVWGWTIADLGARMAAMRVEAMPVAHWRGRQRRALERHSSQLGGRIVGARDRFVLPRAMRRLVDLPHLLLFEDRHAP